MYISEFQAKARAWMRACFGEDALVARSTRAKRFTEEAIELAQACDLTEDQVIQIVKYVYNRPVGGRVDETGGTLITLACLCASYGIDMDMAAEGILAGCWQRIDRIREKDAAKPSFDPTPSPSPLAGE